MGQCICEEGTCGLNHLFQTRGIWLHNRGTSITARTSRATQAAAESQLKEALDFQGRDASCSTVNTKGGLSISRITNAITEVKTANRAGDEDAVAMTAAHLLRNT